MGVRGDVWAVRGPTGLEWVEGGGRRGNAAHFPSELLLLTSLGLTLSRQKGQWSYASSGTTFPPSQCGAVLGNVWAQASQMAVHSVFEGSWRRQAGDPDWIPG